VALNKAHTSVWVKVLIVVLIVAFVSLFMYQGIFGIFALFQQSQQSAQTPTADLVSQVNQKYQGQVDSLKAVTTSNPTSYTPAVDLANTYFDWAQELTGLTQTQGQSQAATSAMVAAFTEWQAAKAAYDQATKIAKTFDPAVQTDRSYATFSSNDATGAIVIAKTVAEKAPTYVQVWDHLGIYYDATGQARAAIAAYQHYLTLNPQNQAGQAQAVQYVLNRLKTLGGSVPATRTP
jgi:tetratricopeptide (TPR) repeat protein